MRLLLIFPPFAMPNKPYLSLPALAGYLDARGLPTAAWDANLAVLHHLVRPADLEARALELLDRLLDLDRRPTLDYGQKVAYLNLRRVCRQSAGLLKAPGKARVFGHDPPEPYAVKADRLRQAVLLATARHFPEHLDFTAAHGYLRYFTPLNPYCSADIRTALTQQPFYLPALKQGLEAALRRHRPGLVGVSLCFPEQMLPAFHCARLIKKAHPGALVVMGGPVVSTNLRSLQAPGLLEYLDGLVLDDGEAPLEALARQAAQPRPDLTRVPGLIHIRNGELVHNPLGPPPRLGDLPAPDFGIMPLDGYLTRPADMGYGMRLSRGCKWARCVFCNTGLPLVRHYDELRPEQAWRRLRDYLEMDELRFLQFTDDSTPPGLLDALSRRIARERLPVAWSASLRFSPELTLERCLAFRRGGCHTLFFGLETLSSRLSRRIKKGVTPRLVRDVLFNASMAGIAAKVYMMVGLPGETEPEARRGFAQLMEMVKKGWVRGAQYSRFEIAPYSEVARDPGAFGIRNLDIDPRADLNPPVRHFDMEGMRTDQADDLQAEFNRILQGRPDSPVSRPGDPVAILGKTYHLVQPVLKLREEVLARERARRGPGKALS